MLTNKMTNRELLELAAKAGGIANGDVFWDFDQDRAWNPLIDDGDALRLAVKLNLEISNYDGETFVTSIEENQIRIYHNGDPYAATRRAIVRAAAEIGRQIK